MSPSISQVQGEPISGHERTALAGHKTETGAVVVDGTSHRPEYVPSGQPVPASSSGLRPGPSQPAVVIRPRTHETTKALPACCLRAFISNSQSQSGAVSSSSSAPSHRIVVRHDVTAVVALLGQLFCIHEAEQEVLEFHTKSPA